MTTTQASWLTGRRVTRHAGALLLALWGVTAVNMCSRGAVALNGHLKGEDYAHFYVLGELAVARDAAGLYDMQAQVALMRRAIPDAPPPYFVPVYGPQVALFFGLFAWLPYLLSVAAWWTVSTAIYLACCWQFWRRCPNLAAWTPHFGVLALASPGFWQVILHGQTSVLVLGCFTLLWSALGERRARRHVIGGVALGLLFYKPQLGLAAGLLLIARFEWRMLAVAAVTVAAQLGAAAAWFGADAIGAYVQALRSLPSTAALLEPKLAQLCSLRGAFQLLGVGEPWALLAYAIASVAVLSALLLAWRRQSPAMAFSLLLIASILVAPHATVYDLVAIAPALLLLADAAVGSGRVPGGLLYAAYLAPLLGVPAVLTHIPLTVMVLVALFWKVLVSAPNARA